MRDTFKIRPVISIHNNSLHDASVAALLSDGVIEAIAAERVDGIKHSFDVDVALKYIVGRHLNDGKLGVIPNYLMSSKFNYTRSLCKHHFHHANSTFFASGMDKSLVVVMDGQGIEYENILYSTSVWVGDIHKGLKLIEHPYATVGNFNPYSIGHFYTSIASLAGFKDLYSEGKLMGLAAYGLNSKYKQFIKKYVYSGQNGTFL